MSIFIKINILTISLFSIACNKKVDSYGPYSIYKKIDDSSTLILTVDNEEKEYSYDCNIKLNLKSLVNYNQFFVDKNGAYRKYETDDNITIIPIINADLNTFQVLDNSIYAKDKNNVYDCRNGGIDNADINTFEAIKPGGKNSTATGKDKNHYYFWNKIEMESTVTKSNK
jgi:hypothetical protein